MKNKLLLTTAIAGSVVLAGHAFAETKVTGNIETTFNATSDNTAKDSSQGLGAETNIGLQSKTSLDNGLTATAGFTIENGASDTEYLVVGNDAFNIAIANDYGNNISATALPHVSDQAGTVAGVDATVTYDNIEAANAHNAHHVAVNFNGMGGTFTARYTPNLANTRDGASSLGSQDGKSATEFLYTGNLGVEGLKVLVGKATEQADSTTGGSSFEDGFAKRADISYNFGKFAVGIGRDESETSAVAASVVATSSDKAAISFAASDNLTLGVVRIETEKKTGGTKTALDEEIVMVQAGYNLGGLGIEISYAEINNAGNASGDSEALQIRTLTKF